MNPNGALTADCRIVSERLTVEDVGKRRIRELARRGGKQVWSGAWSAENARRAFLAVGHAYSELADVASQLAHAVEKEDRASGLLPAVAQQRRRRASAATAAKGVQ